MKEILIYVLYIGDDYRWKTHDGALFSWNLVRGSGEWILWFSLFACEHFALPIKLFLS